MIIFCLGMPGSASTLVFNLAREIVQTKTRCDVIGVESTSLEALEIAIRNSDSKFIVIRAHTASNALLAFINAAEAPILLTTRDPRECVASLVDRLGGGAVNWATDVVRSLAAVSTVQSRRASLAIDFEASKDILNLISRISSDMGFIINQPTATRIASRWNRKAVERKILKLKKDSNVSAIGWRFDSETGINEFHLGGTKNKKWYERLNSTDGTEVNQAFDAIGTTLEPPRLGRTIRFSESLFGTAARPAGIGNMPITSGAGIRLICLCFLGIGRWRLRLRGSLPAIYAPGNIRLFAGGVIIINHRISGGKKDVSFLDLPDDLSVVFDHKNHEHQIEITLDCPMEVLPNPFRQNALMLEASLEKPFLPIISTQRRIASGPNLPARARRRTDKISEQKTSPGLV